MNQVNMATAYPKNGQKNQHGHLNASDNLTAETAGERVIRLCSVGGGALVGWLLDDACRRQHALQDMARELGVTSGYINQLRTGIRKPEDISHEFAVKCGRYLGVPAIVVKLISGSIRISDFAFPYESEEQVLDRALRAIQADPQLRSALPGELLSLPLDVKKMMVMMYAETSSQDVFGLHELPEMLRWLQRAAINHCENEYEAVAGHRDTSSLYDEED
jgi:transcriptional regulator with XRE-family HTH domain